MATSIQSASLGSHVSDEHVTTLPWPDFGKSHLKEDL